MDIATESNTYALRTMARKKGYCADFISVDHFIVSRILFISSFFYIRNRDSLVSTLDIRYLDCIHSCMVYAAYVCIISRMAEIESQQTSRDDIVNLPSVLKLSEVN